LDRFDAIAPAEPPAPPTDMTVNYYHLDAMGSVRAITDVTGTVIIVRHEFAPFGENADALTGDLRRFAGKLRDGETGLDESGARYYANRMGRFTSPDPHNIGASLEHPQSWNAYAYALNNPLTFVDPTGLWPTWFHDAVYKAAFPGLSQAQLQVIERESEESDNALDGGQSRDNAFKHQMRKPFQTSKDAQGKYAKFVNNERTAAQAEIRNSGGVLTESALIHLARIAHGASDGTSPLHVDPNNGNYLLWDPWDPLIVLAHAEAEQVDAVLAIEKLVPGFDDAVSGVRQQMFRAVGMDLYLYMTMPHGHVTVSTEYRLDR
jgi:RHS repeat-associated protein